jgi:hypothetical protein
MVLLSSQLEQKLIKYMHLIYTVQLNCSPKLHEPQGNSILLKNMREITLN